MSKVSKVSDSTLEEIKILWEKGERNNSNIASMFEEYNVTEKNIRDWAKKFGWTREHKPSLKRPKVGDAGAVVRLTDKRRKKKPKQNPEVQKKTHGDQQREDILRSMEEIERGERFSTKELNEILEIILEMIVSGYRKTQIKQFLERKRQVATHLFNELHLHAIKALADSIEYNMMSRYAFHVEARLRLLRKLEEKEDWRGVHAVLMDLGRLEGVYPKDPILDMKGVESTKKVFALKVPDEYRNMAITAKVIPNE